MFIMDELCECSDAVVQGAWPNTPVYKPELRLVAPLISKSLGIFAIVLSSGRLSGILFVSRLCALKIKGIW